VEWISRSKTFAVPGRLAPASPHLLEGLAHAAIKQHLRVARFTLEPLIVTIGKAKVDDTIARTVARCAAATRSWSTILACSRRAGGRRRVLTHQRRRLRAPLGGRYQQHYPKRGSTRSLPNAGDCDCGTTAAPRPLVLTKGASHGRRRRWSARGDCAVQATPPRDPMATYQELWYPWTGRSSVRPPRSRRCPLTIASARPIWCFDCGL
jgi:hypothetical protein